MWWFFFKVITGRNKIDHGRPCGTEFHLWSRLHSIEMTRYRSWFLEYKLTHSCELHSARAPMADSPFLILFLVHYSVNVYEEIHVTNSRQKDYIWSINLGPVGICTSFPWVNIDRTVYYSWLALPNPLSGGCVRANYITYISYLDRFFLIRLSCDLVYWRNMGSLHGDRNVQNTIGYDNMNVMRPFVRYSHELFFHICIYMCV